MSLTWESKAGRSKGRPGVEGEGQSRGHLHGEYRECIEGGMVIKTPNLDNKSLPKSIIGH